MRLSKLVLSGCSLLIAASLSAETAVNAQSTVRSNDEVTCALDGYTVRAYDLKQKDKNCSARIDVYGNPDVEGHYTMEVQGSDDGAPESFFRLVLDDEQETVFGFSFYAGKDNNRFSITEYAHKDTCGLILERGESAWALSYSDNKGTKQSIDLSGESFDRLLKAAKTYRDLTPKQQKDISSAEVSPEKKELLKEYVKVRELLRTTYDDTKTVLTENIGAKLIGDLLGNDCFVDWLTEGLGVVKSNQ